MVVWREIVWWEWELRICGAWWSGVGGDGGGGKE